MMSIVLPLLNPDNKQPHTAEQLEFQSDMLEFFTGFRGGHIARHGYLGEGGKLYSRWLAENDLYRSKVTLAEIETIAICAGAIAEICKDAKTFIECGAGSFHAFMQKTYPILSQMAAQSGINYAIMDVSRATHDGVRQQLSTMSIPQPEFVEGNFFTDTPVQKEKAVIYIAGLTFTNIPKDALHKKTDDIITDTLRYFKRALGGGGYLVFSYATNDGIGADGQENKDFYDDPLIHAYQLSIFERVVVELPVSEDYNPENFSIRHDWHPDRKVLTRHAVLNQPMQFEFDGRMIYLHPDNFSGYMANNFRPSDSQIEIAANRAGFKECKLFGAKKSNIRIAVLSL